MAIALDPDDLEIGVEVHENHTWPNINLTAQHSDNPPASGSNDHDDEQKREDKQEEKDDAPSFFKRLKTGFSSTIKNPLKYFEHKFFSGSSSTAELPQSITESCQLSLDTIRKFNHNIFVQEKWLNETEYLLQNKVLTIGVFGRHNAGKSTLLNALLHHEVLKANVKNETAFILRICHKASNHYGSSCFEDTEKFLLMREREVKGRHDIRQAIKKRNSDIRHQAATIEVDELTAHVPFLCRCSTDDINVVLLDTPGLSEASESRISEVSEHQLMTCSAYVYVFSCTQLEDSIDTDSLRAMVDRDPNAFYEKRVLIAVTKLDEYIKYDESDSDSDDDSNSGSNNEGIAKSLDKHIKEIKSIIQHQCKDIGVSIPDDCIIPLCATGALEARKNKLRGKSRDIKMLKVSTVEELEEVSQILLLEEKLIEIAGNLHHLWLYVIVRDFTRYLDQAMEKLDKDKEKYINDEKKFSDEVKKKEDIMENFKTLAQNLRSKYENESEFCKELEKAYDEDLQTIHKKVDKISKSHFKTFREKIGKLKEVTTDLINSEAEQFFKDENESLKSDDLKDVPIKKMDQVVKKSVHKFGYARRNLEQCLALYCNTATSTKEPDLPENDIFSESVRESEIPAVGDSQALTLQELLENRKLRYSLWDRFKISFTEFWNKYDDNDPKRPLLHVEIVAFLNELEKNFVADCHEYFVKIKEEIVKGYLQEHREIAREHISDVKQHYYEQRKAMDTQVKEWREKAKYNEEMVKTHSDLIDTLEKQKVHLVYLAEKDHNISLVSKNEQ